jgi:stage V sporulation protein D (sporulation-specific penicillin-binding protein)
MLTAAVAAINGGYLLTPRVVDRVIDQDGNTVEEYSTDVKRQVISEETSAIMRDALEQVVSANGGTNAYVKGYRIGGKSGTAQILSDLNNGGEEMYVFSYLVFAPADDPQVAALVLIDSPTQGDRAYANNVVGPLASSVMQDILPYLGITTSYTDEELENQEVSVPSGLVGLDAASVKSKLAGQGLGAYVIGNGTEVIDVFPTENSRVPNGSTVVVYTEGSETTSVTMPNVLGLSPTQASQTLGNYGLNVRVSGGAANNTNAKVSSQQYEAGTVLPRGTVVEIECVVSGEDGA